MGLGVRISVCCIAGDRRYGFETGGRACPTDAATLCGLSGVVLGLADDRCDWECECECEDRGGGLAAVEVITMAACFMRLSTRWYRYLREPILIMKCEVADSTVVTSYRGSEVNGGADEVVGG